MYNNIRNIKDIRCLIKESGVCMFFIHPYWYKALMAEQYAKTEVKIAKKKARQQNKPTSPDEELSCMPVVIGILVLLYIIGLIMVIVR